MRRRRLAGFGLLLAGMLLGEVPGRGQEPQRLPDLNGPVRPLPFSPRVELGRPTIAAAPSNTPPVQPAAPRAPAGATAPPALPPLPGPIRPVDFRPVEDAAPLLPNPTAPRINLSPVPVPSAGRPSEQGACVTVVALGPATVAPGQPLSFEILVRNAGATAAERVRIELPLPSGARFLSGEPAPEVLADRAAWTVGALEVGGERRLRGEIQPWADEVALVPVATYAGGGLRTRVVRPAFGVTLLAPESVRPGAPTAFQVRVANNGSERLRQVVARVKLPDSFRTNYGTFLETDVGDLLPGESRMLNLEALPAQTGRFALEASAQAQEGQQALGRTSLKVADPSLALRLAACDPPSSRDQELRLEVGNPNENAAAVRLSLPLPVGLDFLSANGGGAYDPATRIVTWPVPLPPGGNAALGVRVRPSASGSWNLQAVAAAPGLAEARAALALRVEGAPALRLELIDPPLPIAVGGEAVYEMRLVNEGNAAATNVRVTARLPEGLTPAAGDGPTAARIEGSLVLYGPVAGLTPRADAVYRVRVRGRQAGDGLFHAEVAADHLRQPLCEELPTRIAGSGQ